MFVETNGASWKGVSALINSSRRLGRKFDKGSLEEVIKIVSEQPGSSQVPCVNIHMFDFEDKMDVLYKLLMPKLPLDLATEFR